MSLMNAKWINKSANFGTGGSGELTVVLQTSGTAASGGIWDALDAKNYVDALVNGLKLKGSVVAIADTNIASLSGTATVIDGVTCAADEKVLLTNQTTTSENGIWVVKAGAWVRPENFAHDSHAAAAFVFVEEGTVYHDTQWVCTSDFPDDDVVDTDALVFVQFSGAGSISAGAGLTKSGSTIQIGDGTVGNVNGLAIGNDTLGVAVAAAGAIEISSNELAVKVDAVTDGFASVGIGANGLRVKVGTQLQSGLDVDANGVRVSLYDDTTNFSNIELADGDTSDGLRVKHATANPSALNDTANGLSVAVYESSGPGTGSLEIGTTGSAIGLKVKSGITIVAVDTVEVQPANTAAGTTTLVVVNNGVGDPDNGLNVKLKTAGGLLVDANGIYVDFPTVSAPTVIRESFTLTSATETLTLTYAPISPILLYPDGGPIQELNEDYTVTGTSVALQAAGGFSIGEKVFIQYEYAA